MKGLGRRIARTRSSHPCLDPVEFLTSEIVRMSSALVPGLTGRLQR